MWRQMSPSNAFNLIDFEAAARRKLPQAIFSYIQNAAEDEVTLRRTRNSFDRYAFISRMLNAVSQRHQKASLLGNDYDSVFGIDPAVIVRASCRERVYQT